MSRMPHVTIAYAVILILMGVGGYFYFEQSSLTILIPAFFAIPVLIAGSLAFKDSFLKHSMHAAAMLSLFGMIASFRGFVKFPSLLAGEEVLRPNAVVMQTGMFIVSLLFFVCCFVSFIQVRRQKKK